MRLKRELCRKSSPWSISTISSIGPQFRVSWIWMLKCSCILYKVFFAEWQDKWESHCKYVTMYCSPGFRWTFAWRSLRYMDVLVALDFLSTDSGVRRMIIHCRSRHPVLASKMGKRIDNSFWSCCMTASSESNTSETHTRRPPLRPSMSYIATPIQVCFRRAITIAWHSIFSGNLYVCFCFLISFSIQLKLATSSTFHL